MTRQTQATPSFCSTPWKQSPAPHSLPRMTANFKWSYQDLKVCDGDELDCFRQESARAFAIGNVERGKLGPINRLVGFVFQTAFGRPK